MKIAALVLPLLLVACSTQADRPPVSGEDLLLSSLLDINRSRYVYKDPKGNEMFDELQHFKALERFYIENIELEKDKSELTDKQIKVLFFFAYYAQHKRAAIFQEYLAADLMTVFQKQEGDFLSTLADQPYLISPVCERLNAYFGFEGQHMDDKQPFLKQKSENIKIQLGKHAKACLSQFNPA
ncbi:hypothetical protein [Teredinibacter sp. KSP-S5-2]|uniref:hypothetical protein n=1 Tax=Teredinibacter sp. KSP-S5-2 TaxID=3034506 RepID=UPI0029345B05|nr:hypothetical protein [Teredinibacter sp. KSP-S5-2]WNO09171.1 hypothetical protein P5V12_19705 [Teredinibacter sp. KSP-S5-2]